MGISEFIWCNRAMGDPRFSSVFLFGRTKRQLGHLFFNFLFSRNVVSKVSAAVLLPMHYGRKHLSQGSQVETSEWVKLWRSFRKPRHSNCWRLHWTLLEPHLGTWKERNRRFHLNLLKPHEEFRKRAINDVQIGFCLKANLQTGDMFNTRV